MLRFEAYHGCMGGKRVVQLVVVKVEALLGGWDFPFESLFDFGESVDEIVLSSEGTLSFFDRDRFGFMMIGSSSSSSRSSCLISSSSSSSLKSGSFSGVVIPSFFNRIFSAHSKVPCFGRFKFRC